MLQVRSRDWQRWFPLALAGALLLGTLLFVAFPGWQRQRSLQQRIEELKAELNDYRRVSQEHEKLKREYEALQARFGPPVGLNPETELLPRALSEIEATCRTAGVTIANVQPLQAEVNPQGWIRVPVQLSVRGSLDGIARQLLYELRRASPVMSVERLDLRRSARSEKDFEAQLTISAYALLSEEAQKALQAERARRQPRRETLTERR